MIDPDRPLILASGSRYRTELLRRLQLPFEAIPAEVDETPLAGEAPEALALRLARCKAGVVAARHPGRWVLGSDQVCALADRCLGKPGTRDAAIEQLLAQSGQRARFVTAVVLKRGEAPDEVHEAIDVTAVRFRSLRREEIDRYVDAEQVLDCAGSFKCEGLGITLFEAIESTDPTALVGLPLIAVSALLRDLGVTLP